MYESAHQKASDELDKELKKIYGKIKMCVQEAGVKAFQVRAYKKLPKSGGGEEDPLMVIPRN